MSYSLRSRVKGTWHAGLYKVFRLLPTQVVSALGAALGQVMSVTGERAKRKGAAATFAAFGNTTDPQAAAGAWCRHTGRTLAELACLDRLWGEQRILVEGVAHLETNGLPLLVVGLHTGNWEVVGVALAGLGHAPAGIYAPPANPADRRIARQAREAYGSRLISPRPIAAREALRTLQSGQETLLLYIDEWHAGRIGSPAFGRPPRVHGNIALAVRLAMLTGALVVPAVPERLEGARFRVRFLPPLCFPRGTPRDQAIARLDATISPEVRRLMVQWFPAYVWPEDHDVRRGHWVPPA